MTHFANIRLLICCSVLLSFEGCPFGGFGPPPPIENAAENAGADLEEVEPFDQSENGTEWSGDCADVPKGDPNAPDCGALLEPLEEDGDGFIDALIGIDCDFDMTLDCGVSDDTTGTYDGSTFGCASFQVENGTQFCSICVQPFTQNGVFTGCQAFVADFLGTQNAVFFPGAENLQIRAERSNTTFQFSAKPSGSENWTPIDSSVISPTQAKINISIGAVNLPLNGRMFFDGLRMTIPNNWPVADSPRENEQNLWVACLYAAEAQDLLEGPNPNTQSAEDKLTSVLARFNKVIVNLDGVPKSPDKKLEKLKKIGRTFITKAQKGIQGVLSAIEKNKKLKPQVPKVWKATLDVLNAIRGARALNSIR